MWSLTILRDGELLASFISADPDQLRLEAEKQDGHPVKWQDYGSHYGAHSNADDERSYILRQATEV